MRIIFPSRIPTLRTASRPVSGSITRPSSSTRSNCRADTRLLDKTPRKTRENITLRIVALIKVTNDIRRERYFVLAGPDDYCEPRVSRTQGRKLGKTRQSL